MEKIWMIRCIILAMAFLLVPIIGVWAVILIVSLMFEFAMSLM